MKKFSQEKIDKIKEQFYTLIKERGFTGLRDFARATGITAANILSNINGMYSLSIERAFIFADTLQVPVDTILYIFHEEAMQENHLKTLK